MQTTLTLRRSSINSIVAAFAVVLALAGGGWGGYLLKSQASAPVTKPAQLSTATQSRQVAPPVDYPEEGINVNDAVDRAVARAANSTSGDIHFSSRTGD